jgi:hypothetical protein
MSADCHCTASARCPLFPSEACNTHLTAFIPSPTLGLRSKVKVIRRPINDSYDVDYYSGQTLLRHDDKRIPGYWYKYAEGIRYCFGLSVLLCRHLHSPEQCPVCHPEKQPNMEGYPNANATLPKGEGNEVLKYRPLLEPLGKSYYVGQRVTQPLPGFEPRSLQIGEWYLIKGKLSYKLNSRLTTCEHLIARSDCDYCACQGSSNDFPPLPKDPTSRTPNTFYMSNGLLRYWACINGKCVLLCQHKKRSTMCHTVGCIHYSEKTFCVHNGKREYRYYCAEHGGRGRCDHGKRRPECRLGCGGTRYCPIHPQNRAYFCHEGDCRGKGWCFKHECYKMNCSRCKGSQSCCHKTSKCQGCPEGECSHYKMRSDCNDCRGSARCPSHGKRKSQCHECLTHGHNFCQKCQKVYVANGRYQGYCFRCYYEDHPEEQIPRNRRLKELYVNGEMLASILAQYGPINDKTIVAGGSGRRPDWLVRMGSFNLIVECDEDAHRGPSYKYDEELRILDIYEDLGELPLIIIRFNPDTFEGQHCFDIVDGEVIATEVWEERRDLLFATIHYHLTKIVISHLRPPTEMVKLFYPA